MRIERHINPSLSVEEVRERAKRHLVSSRYEQTSDGVEMVFKRGSVLGSVLSFSASGSMAQFYLRPRPEGSSYRLEILLIVSSFGRITTKGEYGYWENEAVQLEAAILGLPSQDVAVVKPEYSAPTLSSPEPRVLTAEVRRNCALIFAVLAALWCVSIGWVATHTMAGALVGLLIGAGVAFILVGVMGGNVDEMDGEGDAQ